MTDEQILKMCHELYGGNSTYFDPPETDEEKITLVRKYLAAETDHVNVQPQPVLNIPRLEISQVRVRRNGVDI